MSKIALLGAAGAIGQTVAAQFRAQQQPYRVVGRNANELQRIFGTDPLAEIITWNLDDPDSVRAAVRGVDALIYLVGVPYDRFDLHPELMRKTLAGAVAESIDRLLLIGTVYPYGKPVTSPVSEDHPRNPDTFKGKMRKQQEDLLLEADAAGRIRGTVLRLPDFYGPGVERSFLDSLFKAAAQGGTANLISPLDTPHEFVYVPDVGPVVAALIEKPETYGRWWNLAGAGNITQREIVNQVFAAAGRKPKLRTVGKLGLRVIGLFNPFMREFVEMNYLFTTPVLLDDTALQRLLGRIEKTPYQEGLRRSLAYYQSQSKTMAQAAG
jgi:nucleoside-diphosphate-sugar epimerase